MVRALPRHWKYYLSLEDDLIKSDRYVEICPDNFTTFSIEYTRLLLAAGSEVDVVAKMLCEKIAPKRKAENIGHYRGIIVGKYKQFPMMEIGMPGMNLVPWSEWVSKNSPQWWTAYNGVKHHRDKRFKDASLLRVIEAISGLYCMAAHLYQGDGFLQGNLPSNFFHYRGGGFL